MGKPVTIRTAKGYGNPISLMVRGRDLIDLGDGTALLRVTLKAEERLGRRDTVPATTKHEFRGRVDRGCFICNQPDRHPVHATLRSPTALVANPEEG